MILDNLNQQELEVATKWLDFTVESFITNIRKLRIRQTGALMASFRKQVIGAATGRLQLQLSYALYGKFVDMGVGRGMGQGVRKGDDGYDRIRNSRGQLKRRERKAKKWYSREIAYQTKRLAELMSELHGTLLISAVSEALPADDLQVNF
ncbi:hypothetical protein CDA63_11690 [Hymenobacter amundsenii]|uniref:Uncharacterized protein n=1 Tax=Hymenobacter amundsenii TaxID=2006685 RepID=A0A246FMP0_9BACT|nr:hypothetical protein [Hymenobacter amundsenii]OWP62873.1 hypothetical protein CDA63_11690 [Hymenobacter amundsenii]